jgi:hypothetical protein
MFDAEVVKTVCGDNMRDKFGSRSTVRFVKQIRVGFRKVLS